MFNKTLRLMLIKSTFDEVPVDQTNCNCCMKFGYVPEISPSRPTRRRLGLHCTCYHSELCTKGLAYHSIFPFLQKSILCSYGLTHSERSDENKLNKRMAVKLLELLLSSRKKNSCFKPRQREDRRNLLRGHQDQ